MQLFIGNSKPYVMFHETYRISPVVFCRTRLVCLPMRAASVQRVTTVHSVRTIWTGVQTTPAMEVCSHLHDS